MHNDVDVMAYMMAAEKIGNLLFVLEQTMDFMQEYHIKPDEQVKICLKPLVERVDQWLM